MVVKIERKLCELLQKQLLTALLVISFMVARKGTNIINKIENILEIFLRIKISYR